MSSIGAWIFSPLITRYPITRTCTYYSSYVLHDFDMPDSTVVGIGYLETIPDSPYSLQRGYDFQPPVCTNCNVLLVPCVSTNADNFIEFIDTALRPWVRNTIFSEASFDRDALYGSFFWWSLCSIYSHRLTRLVQDFPQRASLAHLFNDEYSSRSVSANATKPAFRISYGALEQNLVMRRTETDEQFAFRQSFLVSKRTKDSPALRDVQIHECSFSDHAAVDTAAISDGIDYFLDWWLLAGSDSMH
ncbi:siderophore esteras-like protein IroE-like protein [Paraphoma chrysanthemicola]|nr:siderophore esteras-like protein IroE-like protein [Paraphoma chrysanthemicola]